MSQRVDATAYYDMYPSSSHQPGDIWVGLPSFGILPDPVTPGLVVTPACDLSNNKVDTVTYLPILSLRRYFSSRSFVPELKRAIKGQMKAAGFENMIDLPDGYSFPTNSDLEAALSVIGDYVTSKNLGNKEQAAINRATSGIRFLRDTIPHLPSSDLLADLRAVLATEFDTVLRRLITNGRPDTHFLPYDEQRAEWSGVAEHSVVLFRYPLSIPLEVLDEAQNVTEDQWPTITQRLRRRTACIVSIPVRPMKRLRVQPRYLSDLITRFTAVFGRIGSPDFTEETIVRFAGEVIS